MSIRTKVIGCFIAIVMLFAGVSSYNYYRSRQSNERLALVNELFLPLSRQIVQLQDNIHGLSEDIRRFYFQSDASSEASTLTRMVRDLYPYLIQKKFAYAEQLLAKNDLPERKALIAEFQASLAKSRATFEELSSTTDRQTFNRLYTLMKGQLQALSRRVEDECQRITIAAQEESGENLLVDLFLCSLAILLGVLTVMLSHRMLTPLPLFIESVKKIADGDFHQSLKVKTTDKGEVALLAREYNRMLAALRERDIKISAQQDELLQSARLAAVGQLSAEVVHEIRNPLNAISLNIDWLENELEGSNSEVSKTIKSISREIVRLNQITESYLVRARLPMTDEPRTPVHDLLHEILDFTREEDRTRAIHIDTELAKEEIFVRTDRSRLKQAFLNVLKNAKEAMPRGGRLLVKTTITENLSKIQFTDSGYGMNESAKLKTFQPFFTTKPNGTGLGLMLTKSIVEEAQGAVSCESELGKGTTFTFQFPA